MGIEPNNLLTNPSKGGNAGGDIWQIEGAQIGGRCRITGSAREQLIHLSAEKLALLRYAIWLETRMSGLPTVDTNFISRATSKNPPTFERSATDMLRVLRERSVVLGRGVDIYDLNAPNRLEQEFATVACVSTTSSNEFPSDGPQKYQIQFFLNYLEGRGFVKLGSNEGKYQVLLTPDGIIHLDKMSAKSSVGRQCFVAMWFNAETNDAWESGIKAGVAGAGYEPFRIDKHTHENRIDDEIISQIRLSRLLVSDFTTGNVKTVGGGTQLIARGGVYFEAGFALGIGIPVVWSVKKDQIDGLHFDTRQYPHIVWESPADLKVQLEQKIVALIGKGPV